ncbi:polysaccharide deacetylase family protein [Longimicrobium terrae]|uniref:Peptidoglycan/xylan/chitin deacetylase (PgdA/CDA1 family) n=1 Tax=Longimicrobium terrae TaxID=1639882 RepID=A0A841H3F7_9BACT|nr:polysaccharide deacetylase family protein [Longimicrobium terrae]MBB4638365.1 peptidoglycan/xylan/chitin deacetylase (PgdA/CDA1 family) [Longimicrobium terrae]MBB6072567.1 peptidoglycan/xylan/chitin deacetylase (PgdA/CDA1 family) [Longimicrobium terrae]NNC28654.1 polysaccharide deacetylase family protein [Longimicrobium terrae]
MYRNHARSTLARGMATALIPLLAACAGGHRAPAAPAPMNALRAAPDEAGIPVLTWHGFADTLGTRGGNLTATYAAFEEMLGFLRASGFRSVFPEEVRPGDDRRRLVVLTFDDGPRDHLRAAAILERYGFRGIFFVIPSRIAEGGPRHLSADEVRRLVAGGHRVSAHGYDHRSLGSSVREVAATMARSRGIIEARTDAAGAGADFAFPFGHYTPEVAEAVSGRFRYLHTVDPGYWDGRSALVPRMLLMNDIDPAFFREYVLGGAANLPAWEPLFASGGTGDTLAFLSHGTPLPANAELLAISPDAQGRSYASHPLGDNARMRGDTVVVDMGGHLRRWFPPERVAVSFALVTREGGRIRYLTPGLLHWVRDPSRPAP